MENEYVVVVGSLNYDIVLKQQRLPERGETYTADYMETAGGGKGANQAVQCAKLGLNTYMAGKVGADSFGNFLIDSLNKYGVDTAHVRTSDLSTGLGIVHALPDGAVYASITTGANYDIKKEFIDDIEDLIKHCKILILQLEIPVSIVEYVIGLAKASDVYVILNAAPAREIKRESLMSVDCLVVNEAEASFYANESVTDEQTARANAYKLAAMTKGCVIITLGKNGSLLCERKNDGEIFCTSIPAGKAEKVVDTTGAGDAYVGAFAYGKYMGYDDLRASIFASAASGKTVEGAGAQPSMPYLKDIE